MPHNLQIPGWMPDIDLEYLELLASRVPRNGVIVEIGSFKGRSSWTLAKSCDPSVQVYCIDLWEDVYQEKYPPRDGKITQGSMYEEFLGNIKECSNIIPIRGNSTDIPWPDNQKVDLVFIDGDHTSPQVDKDIALWSQRLTSKGVLAGHDFTVNYYPDVCRAVINVSKELKLPIKAYEKGFIWTIEMAPIPAQKKEWVVPLTTLKLIEDQLQT